MSNELITGTFTVLLAIVGVAIIAVLVSRNANTTGVLSAGSGAFSQSLGAALSPVTGSGSLGSFSNLGAGL
jgi:hypothetical protein